MSADEHEAPAGATDQELAETLGFLEAEAAELEGQPGQPGQDGPGAQQIQQADPAEELMGALTMARLMVAPMFGWWPEFGQVWSDGTLRGIAQGGAAVMQRHGWTMGGMLSEWGPYIALIGATVPPGLATYQAIKHHKAEQAERAANAPRQHPAPQAGGTP